MTLTQYKRAIIAFKADMDADNETRFQQWAKAQRANAAGFAARARQAKEQRDAMAARLLFVERHAELSA